MNLLKKHIEPARDKIKKLFAEQCAALQKLRDDLDQGEYRCGQFIGPSAHNFRQHGIHGLASAMRVLSGSTNTHQKQILDGLTLSARKYVATPPITLKIIKVSELLIAAKAANDNLLITDLTKILEAAKQNNGKFGWPFIIESTSPKKRRSALPCHDFCLSGALGFLKFRKNPRCLRISRRWY